MDIKCINCRYFKPHELHGSVGICTNRDSPFYNRFIMAEWQCPFFAEFNIEDEDFYWCYDCKVVFHKSMYELHKGHKITKLPYADEDSYLETYVAD